jgi:hypothetical protein
LAEGADRLFAQAALECELPLDVVLPMPQDEYERDFPDTQAEFRDLLGKARSIGTLPYVPCNDADSIRTENSVARNLQYAQVGLHVATRAQILIAVWDGKGARGLGGTAQVVHARLHGRLQDQAIKGADRLDTLLQPSLLDDPVVGLVCWVKVRRRSGPPGPPDIEAPRWILDPSWCLDPDAPQSDKIQGPGLGDLKKLDDYNQALQQSPAQIAPFDDPQLSPLVKTLYRQHQAADALANHYMQNVRGQFRDIFWLAGGMIVSFELWAHVWTVWIMLLANIVLLCIIGWRIHRLRASERHERAIDWRLLSEGLRVQSVWAACGLSDLVSKHYMRRHGSAMQWVRTALSGILPVVPDQAPHSHRWVLEHWIEDQRNYYKNSMVRRQTVINKLQRLSTWAYGLSVVLTLLVFVASLPFVDLIGHEESPGKAWIVVLGLLPALSGLLASYVEFAGYKDDVREHHRMHELFQKAADLARTLAAPAQTEGRFQDLVHELGLEALREQADWALLHRSHELEIPKG